MVQHTGVTTTILVVEDDPAVAELVRAVVNDVPGWGAVVAYDAPMALTLIPFVKSDVLVVDVSLPGMTGIEMLAELRKDPEWPEPPVIVMSASVPYTAVDEALGRDAYIQFLPKPFDIDDLAEAIRLAVEIGRADRERAALLELADGGRPSVEARVS